jgi:arylsulfatase A-like enzyme
MKPAERKNEFDVWGNAGGVGVKPAKKLIPPTPMGDVGAMDWGVFPHRDEDKGDYQAASWGIEKLAAMPKDQPFFLAVGFALPHVPCYITERWFDLYPDSDKLLPAIREDDRADVPPFAWYLHWYLPEPRLKWVRENNQWRNLCRSYLASTSFIDAQIGRLLDALKANDQEQNTIVVVWSDHGWHLGEKAITGKNTLWERSTRVPLIFAGPGVNAGKCTQPAELLDIYPTLIELCGLPSRDDLDGHSLGAQLHDAQAPRSWPAITTHNPGNTTVRSERYRYIRYADGSEEFYDLQTDPHEWTNLIGQSQLESLVAEHRRWLPKADHPFVPGSAVRTLSYDAATGQVVWEGKPIAKDAPVPE